MEPSRKLQKIQHAREILSRISYFITAFSLIGYALNGKTIFLIGAGGGITLILLALIFEKFEYDGWKDVDDSEGPSSEEKSSVTISKSRSKMSKSKNN